MRYHRRRRGFPQPVRATAWLVILALLAPALPARAQETPSTPDISRLIPPHAVAVAAVDLRSEEPTVKVMLEQFRPQERAVGAAMFALLAQMGLSELASGLDFENDIQPWVGRRAYLVGLPTPDGSGMPQIMALVEVRDGDAALRALDVIVPKAVAAAKGKLFQRQVGDTLLRHVAVPGFGHLQLMLREGALALSPKQGLLEEWTKQPAGGGGTDWTKAMRLVKPGPIMLAVTPKVAGMFAEPVTSAGLTAAALSFSASPAGTRMDLAVQAPGGPAGRVVEQLGRMAVTGEALGAVPESAVATLALAPLGQLLESLGAKAFVGASLQGLLGRQAEKVMPRLQPVLDNALKGEAAVALMGLTPEPRLLAVVAEPDEDAAAAAVTALQEALAGVHDARVKVNGAGFAVVLPADGPKLLREVHVAHAGKWLLAATDAETLAAGLATAQAPRPAGLVASASYKAVQAQMGGPSALVLFADTRALGRAFMSLGYQGVLKGEKVDIPEKYLVRLMDAFLLPLGGTGLNLAAREGAGRLTLFQQVDWKSAAGAGAATPAVIAVGAAVALPAFLRAQKSGKESAALQVLKSLRVGEETYRGETGRYGNLNQLKAKGMCSFGEGGIEPTSGYRFYTVNVSAHTYRIVAQAPKSDMITYTLKETGEVTP